MPGGQQFHQYQTITSHLKSINFIKKNIKKTRHITLKSSSWPGTGTKNVVELNRLMGSQPSPSWIIYHNICYFSLTTNKAINGNPPFPTCDWRFNEFPSPAAHALYVTCVEMMALPVAGETVGRCLLDVVLKRLVYY